MSIYNESEDLGRSLHWAAFKLRDRGESGPRDGFVVSKGGRGGGAQRAWQAGLNALTPILALLMLAFLISGCGPGFPIMTAEQETLVRDVKELKEQVAALDGGTTAGAADIQMEVAEAASGLEEIRQEFSFIRGNLEEADFERAQLKEEVQSGTDTLESVSERLDSLDAGLLETEAGLLEIREKLMPLMISLEKTGQAAAALDERLTALEGKGPEAAKAAPETKEQDPKALYGEGFKAIKDKEYRKASDKFTRFIAAYPEHKLADHAQYWLGEIYYAKGDWEKAILEFDKVIKNYPEGDKVPAATLKQGYSFDKLGLTKEAAVLLGNVVEKFPKSDEAAKAKSRLEEMKGASKK